MKSKKIDLNEIYTIKRQLEYDLKEKIQEYSKLEDKLEKDELIILIKTYKIQINHLNQLIKKPYVQ